MNALTFSKVEDFHNWLVLNHRDHAGIWIRFDKLNSDASIGPEQALDEALCFGWIDGQLKRLDSQYYVKYFAKRTPQSIWSTKNKASAERLIKEGKMMPSGLLAVESAKKDGRWERADQIPSDFSIDGLQNLLCHDEKALRNFLKMSPSVQKTYALSYFALKRPESRERRLKIIIERLMNNLPPM